MSVSLGVAEDDNQNSKKTLKTRVNILTAACVWSKLALGFIASVDFTAGV